MGPTTDKYLSFLLRLAGRSPAETQRIPRAAALPSKNITYRHSHTMEDLASELGASVPAQGTGWEDDSRAFTSPRATKCFQGVLGPRPALLCWCPSPARQLLPTRAPRFGSPRLAPRAQLVPGEAAWLSRSDSTAAFCSGGCEGSKPEPFALP